MKTHDFKQMTDTLDIHTEQYAFLKEKFDMDFILYLDIVSKKQGNEFIENLIKYLKK